MAAHSDAEPTTTPAYDPEARDLARPEDRRAFAEWVALMLRLMGDPEGGAMIAASGLTPDGVREALGPMKRGGSEIRPRGSTAATGEPTSFAKCAGRRFPQSGSPGPAAPR